MSSPLSCQYCISPSPSAFILKKTPTGLWVCQTAISHLTKMYFRPVSSRLKEREKELYSHSYQGYRVREVFLEETNDLFTAADLLEIFKGHEQSACECPVLQKQNQKEHDFPQGNYNITEAKDYNVPSKCFWRTNYLNYS